MKKHLLLAAMLLAGISYQTKAQVPGLPNSSATQTVIQELGLGKITVSYSRPNVKGRKIFGGLVPYGQVWRTGANTATSISFSEDVIIEGHNIAAGEYALFSIPEKDAWTIILNKATGQWGAYKYDQGADVLRFKVKTAQAAARQESFTIQFANSSTETVDLSLSWDHTTAAVHVQANDDARITANIEQLMEGKDISNLIYFNSIQYFVLHKKDSDKALGWAARAQKDFPKNAAFELFESRLRLRKGDKAGARAAAEKGIQVAKENKSGEYVMLNQEALALAKD
ncbi:DUF2911 domain-containing protein [Chitinophaga agrisoli]|uniref:DUF2911 domain-containing protein n=1 Tax=Chitinophaga agrisoli TaxID=2607653 RepID=A0A5B2VVL8_9BACT|nr:DUF2911 domain-containing protein [Chitinophaga agrisoli]KAA2242608.1 DUF2911 domain-containing protein [Chitinophaga agrisoli]